MRRENSPYSHECGGDVAVVKLLLAQKNSFPYLTDNNNRTALMEACLGYHIVWAPKYRQRVFYKEKRETVGRMIRELCERKDGVKLIEGEVCPEHIHILVSIPHYRLVSKRRQRI